MNLELSFRNDSDDVERMAILASANQVAEVMELDYFCVPEETSIDVPLNDLNAVLEMLKSFRVTPPMSPKPASTARGFRSPSRRLWLCCSGTSCTSNRPPSTEAESSPTPEVKS